MRFSEFPTQAIKTFARNGSDADKWAVRILSVLCGESRSWLVKNRLLYPSCGDNCFAPTVNLTNSSDFILAVRYFLL